MALSINRNVRKVKSKPSTIKSKIRKEAIKIGKALDNPETTTAVKSENIKSVSYAPELKDLTITFHKGLRTYVYYDVPSTLHRRLLSAPSKGVFFHKFINRRYKYVEVTGSMKGKKK